MTNEDGVGGSALKSATCLCGALRVTVREPPARIHACCCLRCQRLSGSAFSYTAFFVDEAIVSIEGAHRTWREVRDSGRWYENRFCPNCGSTVLSRLEAVPGYTGVSVGCFADPGFAAPKTFYWAAHRHHWLALPSGVSVVDTQ